MMRATRRNFLCGGSAVAMASLAGIAQPLAADGGARGGSSPPATSDPAAFMNDPMFATPDSTRRGDMLYRPLGTTGEEVSLIGVGGHHIGNFDEPDQSVRFIRTAIDRGITFLDNCWAYHGGESERRMGQALKDGYRDRAFLMTKIEGRTREVAARQIDESLKRLDVDHVDLLQLHEVLRLEDPDRTFAEGGAYEALRAAQEAGKTRYLGFTGHKDPYVHLRMLDVARENGVRFDAVQLPITTMDAHYRSFTRDVLPRLVEEGIAPLAMKTFGNPHIYQYIAESGVAKPIELLHYSMSLPVSVIITGMDSTELLEQALEAVRTFDPNEAMRNREDLLARVKEAALTGEHERYKTTDIFDATARNPEWLG